MHNGSVFHPAAVVFPAALAVAQALGRSAAASCWRPRSPATRSASASASSSAARTTRSSTPPAPPARWPPRPRSATCCGSTPEQMLHAFGSAGTQAAGLWEFLRDAADSKQLHTAHAAAAGLIAAYLAHDGFTGARRILEGAQGMAAGMSSDADPARLTDRLGKRWALAETSFKFHASCRHTHPAADALQQVMQRRTTCAPTRSRASPRMCTRARSTCSGRWSIRRPCTRPSSRWAPCSALIALHGARRPGASSRRTIATPTSSRLRERVRMELDAEVDAAYPARWIGKVTVETADGRALHGARRRAQGRPRQHARPRRDRGQGAAARGVLRRGQRRRRCAVCSSGSGRCRRPVRSDRSWRPPRRSDRDSARAAEADAERRCASTPAGPREVSGSATCRRSFPHPAAQRSTDRTNALVPWICAARPIWRSPRRNAPGRGASGRPER